MWSPRLKDAVTSRSVRLLANQPWAEITNVVDKLPLTEKDGIHFGFNFNIPGSKTRVDIPWELWKWKKINEYKETEIGLCYNDGWIFQ